MGLRERHATRAKLVAQLHAMWDAGASLEDIGEVEQQILDLQRPPGFPIPADRPKRIAQPEVNPCIHRGKALQQVVKVECKGCGDKKEIAHRPFGCAVHGRCLPTYRPTAESLAAWQTRFPESELYHLCEGCFERESPANTEPLQ